MSNLSPHARAFTPNSRRLMLDEQSLDLRSTDPAFREMYYMPPSSPNFVDVAYEVKGDSIMAPVPLFRPPVEYINELNSQRQNFRSFGVTANQIKFRRRFYFEQRERPNALAIVNPETKDVLFPGKAKITKEEEEAQKQTELEADKLNQLCYEKQRLIRDIANWDHMDSSTEDTSDELSWEDDESEEEEPFKIKLPRLCPYHDFIPIMSG